MIHRCCVLAITLLLSSCATAPQPAYTYDEIRLVNRSRELVQNVTIRVPATGRVFNCGNIAPGGLCSDHFDPRAYEYNPIRVEWTFGNTARQTDEFTVEVPTDYAIDAPLQGVIEIGPDGGMSAYFVQETGAD